MLRGGSRDDDPPNLRSFVRVSDSASWGYAFNTKGFRCARSAPVQQGYY